MHNLKRLLALTLILPLAGCSTIAKRAIKEARGTTSKLLVVPGSIHSDLSRYRSIEISPVKNELGNLVSPRFINALPGAIRKATTSGERPLFTSGKPVLLVEPQVQWYYEAPALKAAIGSTSFIVALLKLRDGDQEIGRVQIVAKDSSAREDEVDMAISMGKKFAEWVADQRKKTGR